MRILLAAIYPYAFLLLYLIIPFDNYIRALPNILLAILVAAFPFVVKRDDLKKLKSLPVLIFFGLFVYLCLNSLLSGRLDDFDHIKKILIAVGLVVLYIPVANGNPPPERTVKINSAIIFSSLAAIAFSVYNFVLITDATGSFALGESPQVIESLLIDRLYLGMLSSFSILISFQSIQKKYHPTNNYYLANILVNALFLILIASKIAIISLLLLLLLRQFYSASKWWRVFWAFVAGAAIVAAFFLLRPTQDFLDPAQSPAAHRATPTFVENSQTYEIRALVWQCAATIMEDSGLIWTGIGFGETQNQLVSCYAEKIHDPQKSGQFVAAQYNTHNQFLDFYLGAGLVALVLFLAFIGSSFISHRKWFYPTAFLALLVIYCLVENVFHRQIGAYYIGFILIVITSYTKPTENKEIKTNQKE